MNYRPPKISVKKRLKTHSEIKHDDNPCRCRHFNSCSQNFCPLDLDLSLRSGKKQDNCRFMREPGLVKIHGREFVSGGTVMPDTLLIFTPRSNIERLNAQSQSRWKELTSNKEN